MKTARGKYFNGSLALILAGLSFFTAVGAERVALVIGNDAYPTNPLDNAIRDATAFRNILRENLGFEEGDIIFTTNSDRITIFEKFELFKSKAADAEIALVYYAGHGMESLNGKENYILPVDADVVKAAESEAALKTTGVNLMSLSEELADISRGAKIFLVDACRQRPSGRGISRDGGGLAIYADDMIPSDTLMILAAAPERVASDGGEHGPFTQALLEILPAGNRNLMNAFFAVSDRVQEITENRQVPWLKFDGSGKVFREHSFLGVGEGEEENQPGLAPLPMPKAESKFSQNDLLLPLRWLDDKGRETDAIFRGVRGEGENAIVLLMTSNGHIAEFPVAKLSEESRAMAMELAKLRSEVKSLPANSMPPSPGTFSTHPGSPATGEKFENSLGMKFVPVPGTDVLFSIWETRIRDYAEYAKSNAGIDMSWKDFSTNGIPQEPDHPVLNITWQDAKNFCRWLSTREGRTYRLPTDYEWSAAVGIAHLEGDGGSPVDKDSKISGLYPWGREWPPPNGTENLAGQECNIGVRGKIEGYRDEHPFTSPVGSYRANSLGIYDLGGNVREWCEDWFSSSQEYHVIRGLNWNDSWPVELSSKRYRCVWSSTRRGNTIGFRVVLEVN